MTNLYFPTTTVDKISMFPVLGGIPIGLGTLISNSAKTVRDLGAITFAAYRCRQTAPTDAIKQQRVSDYDAAKQALWEHVTFIFISILRMTSIGAIATLRYNQRRAKELVTAAGIHAMNDYGRSALNKYKKAVEITGSPETMLKIAGLYRDFLMIPFTDPIWELASLYFNGSWTPVDKAKALAYYKKAAEKGNINAMDCVENMYWNANHKQNALKWQKKAAEKGYAPAQVEYGVELLNQANTLTLPQDQTKKEQLIKEGLEWIRRAEAQKNANALEKLGTFAWYGNYGPRSTKDAFDYWLQAAQIGHWKAQLDIANLYQQGLGYKDGTIVAKDTPEAEKLAFEWCKKAAEFNAHAQDQLADWFETGYGIEKSAAQSLEWRQKAADNGILQAQLKMGRHFIDQGTPNGYEQALKYYRLAAEQNNAEAQNWVGLIYWEYNTKTPSLQKLTDREAADKAYEYLVKAADKNLPSAIHDLAIALLYRGLIDEAIAKFRQAGELGRAKSFYELALLYSQGKVKGSNGILISKDSVEAQTNAHALLKKAIANPASYVTTVRLAEAALADFYLQGYGVPKSWHHAYDLTTRAAAKGHEPSKAKLAKLNPRAPYAHWMYLGMRGRL